MVIHALSGIRVAVCALMLNTVVSLAKAGVKDYLGALIFLSGFLLATFSPVPTIILVVCAALAGIGISIRKEKAGS